MKYLPAGIKWDEYIAEPAFVVENMIHIWLERDKQFKTMLQDEDSGSSFRGRR